MSFFDKISEGIKNSFVKKKQEREVMEQLHREAEAQRLETFKEQFKIDSKKVAIAKAKKDAAEKSGLQRLRAMNRARNLSSQEAQPGTWFEKLGDYTRKNIAKREENLKGTKMLREEAEKMKKQTLSDRQREREDRMINKPVGFRQSTWKP